MAREVGPVEEVTGGASGTEPLEEGVKAERADETRADGTVDQARAVGTVEVIERHKSAGDLVRELVPEIGIALVAIYLWYVAGNFENAGEAGQLGPDFWPRMAAIGLMVAVLYLMVQTVRDRNRPIVHVVTEFDEYEEQDIPLDWSRLWIGLALAVGYVIATMFIGYLFATAIFLTAFIWIGGQRKWYVPLVGIGGALVFTYAFIGVVYVSLPTGVGIFDTITVAIYGLLGIQ
jgi:hypothetical protein